jgi:lipoate-protein ligase A
MTKGVFYTGFGGEPYANMAFDEWLLEQALGAPEVIFLRLYSWREGAITIGRHQPYDRAVVPSAVGATPVIRRITGGRSLFHDPSEYTYAVAVGRPEGDAVGMPSFASGVAERVAWGLTAFLDTRGIQAALVRRSGPAESRPIGRQPVPCFSSPARWELVSGGAKIVASAQRRVGEVVFQHGAIKVAGVAGHPALPVEGATPSSALQPIDEKDFRGAEGDFLMAMRQALGASFERRTLSARQRRTLDGRAAALAERALSRREVVLNKAS